MFQYFKRVTATKGILLVVMFLLLCLNINAQKVQFSLISSNSQEAVIRVDFPNYQNSRVVFDGNYMMKLSMNGAYPTLEDGQPELLKSATSLIVPESSHPTFEIIGSDYHIVSNVDLIPSKGKLYRNIDPEDIPYAKGNCYEQDKMFFDDTVVIGNTYQFRDYTGVPIQFFPFAYNPVQKTLKVYSYIEVKIRFNSTSTVKSPNKISKTYKNIYKEHFLNYSTERTDDELAESGDILILSPDNFCNAMQPYADWKIKNGYNAEIVPLSIVGTSSSTIKNYIANYYNTHNIDFVVLVGDNGQFPIISVSGNVSDNYYGEIVGNDHYPDVIIGKISAETEEQVNTQVQRFIQYEQNPPETAHFPTFLGIASSQGPGDNNEYDYQHIRNINQSLSNFTYTSGYELFEGNQGGLDAAGNPTANQTSNIVNSGVGIINYCGHGNNTNWVTTNFSVSNINNLENYNKLPFIFSVACVNGSYNGITCFAEAWLRANKDGQPTGAVGALMSTINQPWVSPMYAQDRMIDLLTGAHGSTQKNTFGGIIFNGFVDMLDEYDDYEVTRTWILFGDPTLLVRTAEPQTLNVSYPNVTPISTPTISFLSSVDGTKVALTHNNQIIGVGQIQNGGFLYSLPTGLSVNDTITVMATKPNHIPHIGFIQLIPNDGPYLYTNNITIHDNGNEDGEADYGEAITLDFCFENIGNESAFNVQTRLSTDCPYITLMDSVYTISQIHSNEIKDFPNVFRFKVNPKIPAFENAKFNISVCYNDRVQPLSFSVPLHAPQLSIRNVTIKDTAGNDNGRLDFGEHATLLIDVINEGNSVSSTGLAYISNPDGKLKLYRWPSDIPALEPGKQHDAVAYVSVKPIVTQPTTTTLRVHYIAGSYDITKDLILKIGSKVEDWESGDFSSYEWNNNTDKHWVITTNAPFEGHYAAKSAQISNNQSSQLSIAVNNSAPDTLSFYYMVSSEEDYDKLIFYIDNIQKGNWSGEIGWTKAEYLIDPGEHTFKWEYKKDNYMASGFDMAMIDYICLPSITSSVDIETNTFDKNIIAYPNPTNGKIHIRLDEFENSKYQLFDISGRPLQQGVLNTNDCLSLEQYPKGIYLLRLYKENQVIKNVKIVKQ